MKVELVGYLPSPELVCGGAAAICTNNDDAMKSLKGALASGHDSIAEQSLWVFRVEGVSRTLMAQLTRHRHASFAVQGQRYVSCAKGFEYVIPPRIEAMGEDALAEYQWQMEQIHSWYVGWREKLKVAGHDEGEANEDARFVLPNAATTKIQFAMNGRELLHFFSLRCCNRAQWEIREMADKMLALVYPTAPIIFANAGPGCVRGHCPEGKRCCNRPRVENIKKIKGL